MMCTLQDRALVANSRAATMARATRLTPPTARRFFRGSRFDPPRAGMTISTFTVARSTGEGMDGGSAWSPSLGSACPAVAGEESSLLGCASSLPAQATSLLELVVPSAQSPCADSSPAVPERCGRATSGGARRHFDCSWVLRLLVNRKSGYGLSRGAPGDARGIPCGGSPLVSCASNGFPRLPRAKG